jgi:hypothetical protein
MYQESRGKPFSEANTENATKFNIKEAMAENPDKTISGVPWEVRKRWKRFLGYNSGLWNGNWADKSKLFAQDNDHQFEAMASYLGLTRPQKELGRNYLRQIHLPTYSPFYTALDISFYICVIVADEDYCGNGWVYYPTKRTYRQPRGEDHVRDAYETFAELADSLGLDPHKIEKGLPKFKHVIESKCS